MNKYTSTICIALSILLFTAPIIAENHEDVEIISINGEEIEENTELEIKRNRNIQIKLTEFDESENFLRVKLDGETIGIMEEDEEELRPRSDADIQEGEQPLTVYTKKPRGGDTKIAETTVNIINVELERDEEPELDFDPEKVELKTIDGQNADQVNEIELIWNEHIPIELDGLDVSERMIIIEVEGETLSIIEEGEEEFRPRSDTDIEEGENTVKIYTKRPRGGNIQIAETEVNIVKSGLDPERDEPEPEFDPEDINIDSINGQSAEEEIQLNLERGQNITINLDGLEESEHFLRIKINEETLGIMEEGEEELRPRRDTGIEEGEKTLTVHTKRPRGGDIQIGETTVNVTNVDLETPDEGPDERPEEIELQVTKLNGEDTEEKVVIERDLRGEVPVELEVEGLTKTEYEPNIKFKGEMLHPRSEGIEIEGNKFKMDHLPRIEEDEVEELELVIPIDEDELHVYDSVEAEFTHSVEEDDAEEEMFSGFRNFFGGIRGALSGLRNFFGF